MQKKSIVHSLQVEEVDVVLPEVSTNNHQHCQHTKQVNMSLRFCINWIIYSMNIFIT